MKPAAALRKTCFMFLRLALAFGIIFYLLHKIDMRALGATLRESLNHTPWLIAGICLSYACFHAGMVRWKIILETHGLKISWRRCYAVYFIGQFFNSFMFGSTGGDLARAYYTAQETHHKKTEAVATVIIDRAIGMITLYFIAALMLLTRAQFFLSRWETHLPALLMLGLILATLIGLLIIFNINRFDNWSLADKIKRHPRFERIFKRLLISFYLYQRQTAVLTWTVLISLAAHLLLILQCYCIGRCFQIALSPLDYLTVIPIIIAIAAIPITPGGLGIREGLAVSMLGALAVSSAQALPLALLVYLISVVWGLMGGLIFMGYSASAGRSLHQEIIKLQQETARENGEEGIASAHE